MNVKKKILISLAIAFVALLVVLGIFTSIQRENIAAYLDSRNVTSAELSKNIEKEKATLRENLKGFIPDSMRDLTTDEEMMLISGQISQDEAHDLMGISDYVNENGSVKNNYDINSGAPNNGGNDGGLTNGTSAQDIAAAKEAKISKAVTNATAQLYSAKALFLGKVGGIANAAVSEFNALPSSERTSSSKAAILSKYISKIGSIESQCDSRVNSILGTLEAQLESVGGDTAIVKQLQSSYETEKAAEKSYYLNQI
ncbi:MAG: hypothetical protein RSH79_05465 [Clostridiales bacterium]